MVVFCYLPPSYENLITPKLLDEIRLYVYRRQSVKVGDRLAPLPSDMTHRSFRLVRNKPDDIWRSRGLVRRIRSPA